MDIITSMILCARTQNLVLSVSVRRVYVVFSTARFKGGEKPRSKTSETGPLRKGIQKPSALSWERVKAIAPPAHGFTRWPNRATTTSCVYLTFTFESASSTEKTAFAASAPILTVPIIVGAYNEENWIIHSLFVHSTRLELLSFFVNSFEKTKSQRWWLWRDDISCGRNWLYETNWKQFFEFKWHERWDLF